MKTKTITIIANCPDEASGEDVAKFVKRALDSWGGGYNEDKGSLRLGIKVTSCKIKHDD